jgi:predicted choloylglycine hydrolase
MKDLPEGKFILREKGLTVLQLEGNCSEIGLQHGASLREEIHLIRSKFIDYLSRGKWSVFGRFLYWLLMIFAKTMDRYIPDALRKEMLSVSKGASIPYYFILLLNVLDDLLNLLFCSSFAITKDGHTICGRNLDYDIFTDLMTHLNTVFVYKPKEGYPFLSLAWPGYVGCLTGMNANGLVLTSHASYSLDKNRKGVPTGLLYRYALQHALSINDVERAITSARRSIGNNVLLASDNEAFILELSAKNWKKRKSEEGIITVTNHYQTSAMKTVQASFISKPPGSSLPDDFFSYNHSIFRDEQLGESCKKEPFLVNEAIEALRGEGIANEATVQSVVFLPSEKTIWVAKSLDAPVSLGKFIKLEDLFYG